MRKHDLGGSFDKLLTHTFYSYRGLLLMRTQSGGYVCLGKECSDLRECDKVIDAAGEKLKQSINRVNNENSK